MSHKLVRPSPSKLLCTRWLFSTGSDYAVLKSSRTRRPGNLVFGASLAKMLDNLTISGIGRATRSSFADEVPQLPIPRPMFGNSPSRSAHLAETGGNMLLLSVCLSWMASQAHLPLSTKPVQVGLDSGSAALRLRRITLQLDESLLSML